MDNRDVCASMLLKWCYLKYNPDIWTLCCWKVYGLGNSWSETGLWSPVVFRLESEGAWEEEEVEEVSVGRRISADCWCPGICCCCCCCCGSVCLCTSNDVRLPSMGAFRLAKLDRESLDSWMAFSSWRLGPWVPAWLKKSLAVRATGWTFTAGLW